MLRTLVENYSPAWMLRLLQGTLHEIRRQCPVDIAPFDVLYENAEKRDYVPAQEIHTPEAEHMRFLRDAEYLNGPIYRIPEDYVAEIDHVLFSPNNNVLMTEERTVIDESLNTGGVPSLKLKDFYLRDTVYLTGYSTPLRSRHSNYYHTLIDCIPRLIAFDQPPYNELEEIQLLCPGGLNLTEEYLVDRLGPDNLRVVETNRNTLYHLEKALFTPFKTRKFAGYLPEFYRNRYREQLLPDRPSMREHRIFVSRKNTYTRIIENRDELYKHLKRRGFEILVLEELPFQAQIELFYDAEIVVGAHGSGLTNILFSPHLKVVELFPTWYVIPHYYYLSLSLDHEYSYLCSTNSYRNTKKFVVDPQKVVELIQRTCVLEG